MGKKGNEDKKIKEDIMTVIRRMEGEAIAKKMCEHTMSRESFQ